MHWISDMFCIVQVLTTLAAAASPLPSSAKLCEPMHEVFSENPFMKTSMYKSLSTLSVKS